MHTSTEEAIERLQVLHDKLEDEGRYAQSNTAWLAIAEIKRLAEELDKIAAR